MLNGTTQSTRLVPAASVTAARPGRVHQAPTATMMASSGLFFGILMGCLLLFSPLLLIGCNGQPVGLNADGTGQHAPFIVTFGDGQPTADVTSYLPLCVVGSGSGPWIRLEKTDGSIVLAETGAFSGGTLLFVNSTAHPILDTSYTGLYHCRTVDHNSSHTYQLNIVAKQVRSAFPTSQRLISRDASSTIPCMSSGSSNLNASWTSTPALDMPVIRTTNLPKIVHSVFTFQLNDQTIVRELNDLDTSRVTLNVTCTTWYTEGDCTGIGSTPPRPQRVTERCIHASRPISSTVSVTVEEEQCPDLVSAHFNYKPIAGFSRAIGAQISILCQAGYLPSNGLPITNSTCQIGGVWYPSPPGCEKVSPTNPDTDATPQSATSAIQIAQETAMSSVTVRSASPAYSSTTDDSAEEGVQSATVVGVGIAFGVVVFALSMVFIFALRRHCREPLEPLEANVASSSPPAATSPPAASSLPADNCAVDDTTPTLERTIEYCQVELLPRCDASRASATPTRSRVDYSMVLGVHEGSTWI
ncbi:uncharacterized protein LOC135812046 isoform X1 [Sycon ciliatum]|uniref:uncharacterized protein LOC135812046 isoform X1 n=1 Tax=Sycon ciliatum TaxID=27933 RepID=UPI0031F65099